jgi:hypothetical protein
MFDEFLSQGRQKFVEKRFLEHRQMRYAAGGAVAKI